MSARVNRQWRLVARPSGLARESDFEWSEQPVPAPKEGQVLVHNMYLSLDPTMRTWIDELPSYFPSVALGEIMRGSGIGVVEQSRNTKFPEGTLVLGLLGWQDYAVTDGTGIRVLPRDPSVPVTAYFGLLGIVGMTAYFGLLDIGKPQGGETLVVSAAAGAVGSLAGQIGKIKGCRVVGIVGSDEKCHWIKNELGFDAAINYRMESVPESLKKHCPDGIDVDFENVGGPILDAAMSIINLRARIILCGLISTYNSTEHEAGLNTFPHIMQIIFKRARIEGFLVLDYLDRAKEAITDLARWYAQGKIRYRLDVVDGLESAPRALNKLFDGTNKGKLIIKV